MDSTTSCNMDACEQTNENSGIDDGFNLVIDTTYTPADEEQNNQQPEDNNINLYEEEIIAVQDDDEAPDSFIPIVAHGLSNEDYDIIFNGRHPTSSQWKDSEGPRASNVSATIDGGRKMMWDQAKTEIYFVRKKVKAATGGKDPTIKDLWDLIFGPKSKMGQLLEHHLLMKREDIDKALGTYCLAAAYNLSKTKIFDKNSLIDLDGLANEQTYQLFWNLLSKFKCNGQGNTTSFRGFRPLWLVMQSAFNDTCRELFVEGFDEYMRITIDDDKMHYQAEKIDTQGLKRTQHVRDNRKGFVAHTACYTASGLPIGIEWERSNDDTTTAATERLIRGQLSPMSGQNGPPMLANTQFAMDRGYCLPTLLYDFFLPSGADVLGTVKRCPMFPFTFDQKIAAGDKRQVIDAKGFKTIFLKKLAISEKKLTGIAYRDGKGGITLGLTTFEQTRHWDLVLTNPLDSKHDEEKLPWYKSIREDGGNLDNGETEEQFKHLFDNLPVDPFTIKQNTPEWFLLRAFSCTSSATDQLLHEVKKTYLDPKYQSLINETTAAALKIVLDIVQGPKWDKPANIHIAPQPAPTPTIIAPDNVLQPAETDNAGGVDQIEVNVQLLTSGNASDIELDLKAQISNHTMTEEVLRSYLEKIGIKPVRDKKKNEEKFKNWLDAEASSRPYVLWNKSRLIDACIQKFGGKKSNYNSYDNNYLIHRLSTYQGLPSNHHQTLHSQELPSASNLRLSLLKRIFDTSFMPKLTAKGREYCKMGHSLELPFAQKLLQHSKEGLTKFQVEDIYRVGLVGKRGRPYAKASCDFIAVVNIDGEKKLVGVECKARVTPGTQQRERDHREYLSRFHRASPTSSDLYTVLEASPEDFHIYVDSSHEAIQLLHQAYVCSFEYVLLLIGDSSGNIIRGLWVHFDHSLLLSYDILMLYFYEVALSWAYQPDDNPLPKQDIEHALARHKTLNMESFLGHFYLWRYVCKKMTLPIPQLERIIPFVLSQWNAIKGGSDTITKLLCLNMYDPPCNVPQGHAIARMLLLGCVIVHRLNSFFTAKDDLEKAYPSLKHFRRAASERCTFYSTLLQIVNVIRQREFLPHMSSSFLTSSAIITGALTRRNDTRTMEVAWGNVATGATPQRSVKKWYEGIHATTASEITMHERMIECKGVPVYRVDIKTKSNRAAGSRGRCVECSRITNFYCILCKKWLCDPQLAANRSTQSHGDPKYITIMFDDGKLNGKEKKICAIYSCWHKSHRAALEADGAVARGLYNNESIESDISSMTSY